MLRRGSIRYDIVVLAAACIMPLAKAANVELMPADSPQGYIARVLINETAFPGEPGYRSEEDSAAGMQAVLWVLHSRIHHVPAGYTQRDIASVESESILDVITARGVRDQVDGFYRDRQGRLRAVPRVHERVKYLLSIARSGPPGRVSRLLEHAQRLASSYFEAGPHWPDIFRDIRQIGNTAVTGRSYSWMSALQRFSPGGRYIPIPSALGGILGGNRFFTLRDSP